MSYQVAVGQDTLARVPRETWLEAADAYAILAFAAAVWLGFGGVNAPRILRRGVSLPAALRVLPYAAAAFGTVVFTLAILLDLSNFNPEPLSPVHPRDYPALYSFAANLSDMLGLRTLVADWNEQWTIGVSRFGVEALSAFGGAAAGVWTAGLRWGLLRATRVALEFFVGPLLLVFEGGSYFLNPEVMTMSAIQATAGWQVAGVPVLSNYFVLLAVAVPLSSLAVLRICFKANAERKRMSGARPSDYVTTM